MRQEQPSAVRADVGSLPRRPRRARRTLFGAAAALVAACTPGPFGPSGPSGQPGQSGPRGGGLETGAALRLVFVLSHPDGQALALADADGKNIKVLVPAGRMDGLWAPRFAPDGQSIAFAAVAEMAPVPAPPRPGGQSDPPAPGGSGASSSPPPPAAPAQPRPSPVGRPAAADGSPPVGALRALAGGVAARPGA